MGTSIESATEPQAGYPGAVYEAGDEAYPGGYYIHTVTLPDESISIIAKWFTGDLMKWEVLAKCNQTINPNRIFSGNKIKIPREIMIRQDPMTPEFVMESQPQQRKNQHKKRPHLPPSRPLQNLQWKKNPYSLAPKDTLKIDELEIDTV